MHKCTFLDNTANLVLNSSFLETSVTMAVKHPIWTIVSTWKSDKLQNQYSCFPQVWVFNGGYYNSTFCIA